MPLTDQSEASAVPLHVIEADRLSDWMSKAEDRDKTWAETSGFSAGLGELLLVPAKDGSLSRVLVGWGRARDRRRQRFSLGGACEKLTAGRYRLAETPEDFRSELEVLGWLLAEYRFTRYRSSLPAAPERFLVCPAEVDRGRIESLASAEALARDLINTPASEMGPEALEAAAVGLANEMSAGVAVVRGVSQLREASLPLIATVGAAGAQSPRLIDLAWGDADARKVTIVGKGVCFDTGGLNIKPGSSMGLMKKDMGGAASALGLARMIMSAGLDVRLRVLIPAVENAISSAAMRPGDILWSRKGLSVEINNTDAEGRLILADALAVADEEGPDLLISLATLTGAARVALGPDVPAYFTDDDTLASDLEQASRDEADPLWRLPFWDPYEPLIEPGVADLDNAPSGGMAGAITAALFLRRFVDPSRRYVHVDLYGWTPQSQPGRPKGGAGQAARALYALIEATS